MIEEPIDETDFAAFVKKFTKPKKYYGSSNYIFQDIAKKGSSANIGKNATKEAREWYRNAALNVATVNKNRMMNDKENIVPMLTEESIGKMYMYYYDPKLKDVLPYYDIFPLIFVLSVDSKGFLGMNTHYLPPIYKSKLMNAIYDTANNNKMDDTTKLKISYQILSNASKYKYFKPCLKRYLWGHVGSQFLNIKAENWDSALMLPTARFQKMSQDKVWTESVKDFD